MKQIFVTLFLLVLSAINLTYAFSKYGRSCKDIGCLSNEVCKMAEDPCSYYQRSNDCGLYPTCVKVSNAAPTCATFVCPPTKMCRMDGSTPKCVDDPSAGKGTLQSEPIHPGSNSDNPAPGIYPQIPRGQTTPRPNVRPPGYNTGGGYQGGSIGSGYPGQGGSRPGSGYPVQGGGYPGYPQQPPQNYPGYPSQGGAYPNYPNQPNYPNYPNYPQQGQGGRHPGNSYGNRQGQKSEGSSILDSLSDTLKNLGLFWLLVQIVFSRLYKISVY